MVWRSSDGEPSGDAFAALADLVQQLETGSATAENRLISHFVEDEQEQSDDVLNHLAASAADGSPYSLELLLGLITEYELAGPAIGRHVKDEALAEEVSQEVLIAVARSIHRYRSEAKFTTWLYALARNISVSELRRHRPTSSIADEDILDDAEQRRVSSLVAERDLVREAIYSLPPVFRETVLLRDVDRLSYSEIAERQGLTINTVRSRLSRGRALLASNLPASTAQ